MTADKASSPVTRTRITSVNLQSNRPLVVSYNRPRRQHDAEGADHQGKNKRLKCGGRQPEAHHGPVRFQPDGMQAKNKGSHNRNHRSQILYAGVRGSLEKALSHIHPSWLYCDVRSLVGLITCPLRGGSRVRQSEQAPKYDNHDPSQHREPSRTKHWECERRVTQRGEVSEDLARRCGAGR